MRSNQPPEPPAAPERWRVAAALGSIYLIWGSTYLAIRLLAETLPGLSLVGLRFVAAGLILYPWARRRGAAAPSGTHWTSAAITGCLMLGGGTGGVVVAIRHLDSGLVALLIGTVPLWIAFLFWLWPGGRGPSPAVAAALAVGFVGTALLAAPREVLGSGPIHLPSVLVVMASCLAWSLGSLISRDLPLPSSPPMVSALQMFTGGSLLMVWGAAAGEWNAFDPQGVSATSAFAFLYLVVFGSLVAFSAYSWLIRTAEPNLVSTYAYVNPVVAIFLGWLIADEAVGPRTVVAAALILGSVVLVTRASIGAARRRP